MPCIDSRRGASWVALSALAWLAGCGGAPPPATPAPVESRPAASPVASQSAVPAGTGAGVATGATVVLPPPRASRNWAEYRRQAAERLVAAHPQGSYTGTVPDVLLAIPVVEVELNRDGTVRRIEVLRHPRQARDTTDLALAAIRRAAPFGDVSHLPRPWKFAETFLFDDHRRFKPRTLEE